MTNRITELFGHAAAADSPLNRSKIAAEQQCPYLSRKCLKNRKSQPGTAIGTCTVRYGSDDESVIICPYRMLERRQVFTDCLHLLTSHQPGNELHVVGEVAIPGGSVDYFLVSAEKRKAMDFVGIEFQDPRYDGDRLARTPAVLGYRRPQGSKERYGQSQVVRDELEDDGQNHSGATPPQDSDLRAHQ
jgi:hypothetical protein